GAAGASAAVLLIAALYPLTQLYQVEEDASRGDATLAVVWGPRRCLAFAQACTLLGGALMLWVLARRFGTADAVLVGLGLVVQMAAINRLAGGYEAAAVVHNYRSVM